MPKDIDKVLNQDCHEFLTDIAFKRLQLLEDTTDAIDRKASSLLGFVSLVIVFAMQFGAPELSSSLDMHFSYAAFTVLFASLIILIVCLAPRKRQMSPDPSKMLENLWGSTLSEAREQVAASLDGAWRFNEKAHGAKALLFTWAVWLSVIGMGLLAINVLVIRVVT